MKAAALLTLLLSFHVAARADFSYTSTRKTTGGAMAAMAGSAGNRAGKTYFKGQKTRSDEGNVSTIIDFDARTLTVINNAAKTYSVSNFGDMAGNPGVSGATMDVKETGQHKTVNGFDARELVITIQMDMPTGRGPAIRGEMDMHMWISGDVPGGKELRAFYERNASKFPAMGGGNNAVVQNAMTEIQKKMASLDGIPVEQVIQMKQAGGAGMPAMPQMTAAQSAQMDAARARLEAMKAQGGPQAAIAEQTLARMGAMSGGGAGAGSGSLLEMTIDSSDFSTAPIPDSVFAIPAGYQKAAAK